MWLPSGRTLGQVDGLWQGQRSAIEGLPDDFKKATLTHYRIDQTHSNSYTAWQKMGKPQNPTPDQYAKLEEAGQLAQLEPTRQITPDRGKMKLKLRLPRQGVSLLVIERL